MSVAVPATIRIATNTGAGLSSTARGSIAKARATIVRTPSTTPASTTSARKRAPINAIGRARTGSNGLFGPPVTTIQAVIAIPVENMPAAAWISGCSERSHSPLKPAR